MEKKKFIYYQEDEMWIGWLEEFPDYRTQGETLAELEENLKDIYEELSARVKITCTSFIVAATVCSSIRRGICDV